MKLLAKGLLLVAIPSVFQVGMLGLLFHTQQQAAQAERLSWHSKEILRRAAGVLDPLQEESIRFRGALLAQQPALIPDKFWNDLDLRLADLQKRVVDNPRQVRRLETLRETIVTLKTSFRHTYDIAISEGAEGLARRYRPGGGVVVMDRFKSGLAEFRQEEERLDFLRSEQALQVQQKQSLMLMGMVAVSILTAALAAYVFSRSIGHRLNILTGNAARLASGEALAAPIGGSDEISVLDKVLHTSSVRLSEADRAETAYQTQLQQRAAELEELNNDLRRQKQDNDMFVYSVSHDLRSPLVNLQGFGKELGYSCDELRTRIMTAEIDEVARSELTALIDGEMRGSLRYLNNAVLRSANIIDALLKLSRAGRIEYHIVTVNVTELVARIIDALHATITQRRIAVTIKELPAVEADAGALEQVFANLIQNAVTYLEPKRPGQVEIGCHQADAAAVTYYVRDNGLGIAATHLDKLFVAFKRLHANTAPGEGIGLAYVQRVVDRHGGRVWVVSEEGVGSTFFMMLPHVK